VTVSLMFTFTSEEIDEVFTLVPVGTPVESRP